MHYTTVTLVLQCLQKTSKSQYQDDLSSNVCTVECLTTGWVWLLVTVCCIKSQPCCENWWDTLLPDLRREHTCVAGYKHYKHIIHDSPYNAHFTIINLLT